MKGFCCFMFGLNVVHNKLDNKIANIPHTFKQQFEALEVLEGIDHCLLLKWVLICQHIKHAQLSENFEGLLCCLSVCLHRCASENKGSISYRLWSVMRLCWLNDIISHCFCLAFFPSQSLFSTPRLYMLNISIAVPCIHFSAVQKWWGLKLC